MSRAASLRVAVAVSATILLGMAASTIWVMWAGNLGPWWSGLLPVPVTVFFVFAVRGNLRLLQRELNRQREDGQS